MPEGLAREVREETGVVVGDVGTLAYVTHVDWQRPARVRGRHVAGYVATIWTFEVASWTGEVRVDDPDRVVVDAVFVHVDDAARRLAATAWLARAAGYLRGEVRPGSFHAERWQLDGTVETIHPVGQGGPSHNL